MILQLSVLLLGVPLGILSKKVFRWYCPSKTLLTNHQKSHSLRLVTIFVFFSDSLYARFMMLHRESPLTLCAGVLSFAIGWQLSVLGLTGGIATGKSTASAYIKSLPGFELICADEVAKEVVAPGESGFVEIVRNFGSRVLDQETGEINRRLLGMIVFSDKEQKRKLERITHPRIIMRMLRKMVLSRLLGRIVVIDVPLLFEPRTIPLLYLLCSETILIDIDESLQFQRLLTRNPELSKNDALERVKSQLTRVEKLKIADYVIPNNGTIQELHSHLRRFFQE